MASKLYNILSKKNKKINFCDILIFRIIDGFEDIKEKLLEEPRTTAELVELAEYIDEARGSLLAHLKEDIVEGLKMFFALMDHHLLNAEDRLMSIAAQTMHRKILPAFEKSAIVSFFSFS